MKKEMTPKRFRTFASAGAGEAGYYVEVAVFGGVLTLQEGECECYTIFTTLHSPVIIVTSKAIKNIVSIDALGELRNLGLCPLASPAASPSAILFPSPSPTRNRQRTSTMLCDSDDEESGVKDSDDEDEEEDELLPNHCPREYPNMKLHLISFYH